MKVMNPIGFEVEKVGWWPCFRLSKENLSSPGDNKASTYKQEKRATKNSVFILFLFLIPKWTHEKMSSEWFQRIRENRSIKRF